MTGASSPHLAPPPTDCDLAIVGAGLAGGLIAMAMKEKQPDLRLLLIDDANHAGGNHIWSFFDSDLDAAGRRLVAPLVTQRWTGGHEVRFPAYRRELTVGYNSITSGGFDAHLREILGDRLRLGHEATAIRPQEIILAGDRRLCARAVIDARGLDASFFAQPGGTKTPIGHFAQCDPAEYSPTGEYIAICPAPHGAGSFLSADDSRSYHNGPGQALECGWQKFVGQRLRLAHAHNIRHPVIMDATVDQIGGYRFIYILPGTGRHIFVEDTYYEDEPHLNLEAVRRRIAAYAAQQGWRIEAIEDEETGVLPVTKGGDFDRFWPAEDRVARAGVRAGLFHPATGYSLPFAVDFALALARENIGDGAWLARWSRDRAARHWRRGGYYRLLGRMLFDAAEPAERYRIFERFYRLPAPLITRFYSGRSTLTDKIRILCGRPPVPIRAAMQAIMKRKHT